MSSINLYGYKVAIEDSGYLVLGKDSSILHMAMGMDEAIDFILTL